ncbi:MAG TPA: aldehyde dehydrogenase [Ignavibacteriales bacterium]|nr:aldehyde dehydrogenase [Ignavibacteriales bacterium]
MNNINEVFNKQKLFFADNGTRELKFRKEQLKKFLNILKENEEKLNAAIYKDLKKSPFETYATELALIYHEIKLALKKLNRWTKQKRVRTNLANFPARSYLIPEPYGNALIIGAWNYPYQLSLLPAVSAIASGNTVIIKPSELSKNCSAMMAEIINNNFDPEFFYVLEGGAETARDLLQQKFNKIFFTGNPHIGKLVMKAAAENLASVTLELGGKSPTIILDDANLKMAAKRLAWAKFLNAGQTCVAPDYLLIHKKVKNEFLNLLVKNIIKNQGEKPDESDAFLRIINEKHFDRLAALIEKDKIFYGGITNRNEKYISPTILHNVSFDDKIMEDEIFGPLLPVIEFENTDDILKEIKSRPKPLSFYLFTNNRSLRGKILNELSFGGGAVNDAIMYFTNSNLPFGGVGNSGIGAYHGEAGFKEFSHYKSVLVKANWFEPFIKYPPYSDLKKKLLKLFLE